MGITKKKNFNWQGTTKWILEIASHCLKTHSIQIIEIEIKKINSVFVYTKCTVLIQPLPKRIVPCLGVARLGKIWE